MYDERTDFIEHNKQIDAAFRTLKDVGYEPASGQNVLDLGGGEGMHVGTLSQVYSKVFCIDIINYATRYGGEFHKLIAEKYARCGYPISMDRVAFVEADATNLLFRNDFFDACMSFNSFEHIPDPGKALDEIVRVLKPGGVAYIDFDPIWTCDTGSHFFHKVTQPWAHLVLSTSEFHNEMRKHGASDVDLTEFDRAMNRWREFQFAKIFRDLQESRRAEVLFHDSYSAVADEKHLQSPYYFRAKVLGYADYELMLRRLRWVIRKTN